MHLLWYLSLFALLFRTGVLAAAFDLLHDYSGSSFFTGWEFYGKWDNLTLGNVTYQTALLATEYQLVSVNEAGNAIIRVDNRTTVSVGERRNSVLPGLASVSRSTMGRVRGHTNTQSTSSVSTTGTSTSSHTTSTRLSQSSASSLAFDEPLLEVDEKREGSPHGSVEVSPSSALRAAKLHRRKSREQPSPLCSPLADTSATLGADSPRTRAMKRSSLNLSSGLPPPAIPGIGVLAGQPVSSWMETMGSSVGRKWEELQKGETFTKSQKRASVILSDVSQTFFSALTSPGPSSGTFVSVSSNPFAATLSPLSTSPSASTPPPMMASSASTHSLLDDDSEAQGLGSVMVPDSKGSSSSTSSRTPSVNTKDQSDDEWNW
ncbi:predicted protein [Postia placenta Mad-698-R]|nr:predicted protein [Postia placenta Mad-698-R]